MSYPHPKVAANVTLANFGSSESGGLAGREGPTILCLVEEMLGLFTKLVPKTSLAQRFILQSIALFISFVFLKNVFCTWEQDLDVKNTIVVFEA